MGQKLAVLGPSTVGKAVGPNETHARSNQGVCKQIFDLRELLLQPLDRARVRNAYASAVDEATALRSSSHPREACLADALGLIRHLRQPTTQDRTNTPRYALWSGYRDSMRWIAEGADGDWKPRHYRVAGGCIARLIEALRDDETDFARVPRPLFLDAPPEDVLKRLDEAQGAGAEWFSEADFAADAHLAWAWAPWDLW